MDKKFSPAWKSSNQPRKQRKYLHNAPLHTRKLFVGVHLSKDLKAKYSSRAITVREGDTVKVMRGQHKGKTGKVRGVDRSRRQITIEGVEQAKRDGAKVLIPIQPSNCLLVDVVTTDKRRFGK